MNNAKTAVQREKKNFAHINETLRKLQGGPRLDEVPFVIPDLPMQQTPKPAAHTPRPSPPHPAH